ncbi:MAG: hypothetical protein ABR557_05785 [Pyrinomonadaceae bacterium]
MHQFKAFPQTDFADARVTIRKTDSVILNAQRVAPQVQEFSLHRLVIILLLCCALFVGIRYGNTGASAAQQSKTAQQSKLLTAEQVAEATIFVYGSRPVLAQIRRNGIERGRILRYGLEGRNEESSYERRFIRGESMDKDKIRLDQKAPTLEYSLIYGDGRLWGIINGAAFTPRQDAANTFLSQNRHSIDTLLRYKENGSTITMVGKEQQKGLDLYVLNLVDKDRQSTRYYISSKTYRILWLEYEEPPPAAGGAPLKFVRRFMDYRWAQSTLVPYRSVLTENGRDSVETRIMNVIFGVKIDDSVFKNPEG